MSALALALTAALAAAAPADPAFCPNFRTVYDQGVNGFRPFRGVQDESPEDWVSTAKFPGAAWCRISESASDYRYSCTWRYGPGQSAYAVGMARTLADGVRDCLRPRVLPPDPDRDTPPPRDPAAKPSDSVILWSDNFYEANTKLGVQVRVQHIDGRGTRYSPESQLVTLLIVYRRRHP